MAQIRRQSVSKQHAKIRGDLSVHTTANGFRKDVGCAKTRISVRFRRKIALLVNTLFLHAQLFSKRWDISFLTFACYLHTRWHLLCIVGGVVHKIVHRWFIIADSGLKERFGRVNCCSLWWRLVTEAEKVWVACESVSYTVSSKNLPSILF